MQKALPITILLRRLWRSSDRAANRIIAASNRNTVSNPSVRLTDSPAADALSGSTIRLPKPSFGPVRLFVDQQTSPHSHRTANW